jgi:Leucine-rich repeat (LRR) protein
LKELSLSFNHLTDIAEEAFGGLEDSLEILELSFAFSTDVFPQRALRPLTSLLWLVLDNNNFHTIETTAFYSFQQLRYINLESNRLHYLPERIFLAEIHEELRDVKFGFNFLEAIPESTFHNLTELRALDLTGNRIRSLDVDSIKDCPRLVTVSLANNRISSIDPYALSGLSGLRFLHLEFNKLTQLDFEAFADR